MNKNIISEFSDNSLVYNHLRYENLSWTETTPQTHDVFEMIYVKNGDLTYLIEGKKYPAKKHDLLLTRPNKRHILEMNRLDIYDRYDIFFEENPIVCALLAMLPESINVMNLNEFPIILELFSKMDFYCAHFKGNMLKNILVNISEEILYNIIFITQNFPENKWNGTYTANPIIATAVDYIEKNLYTDICLESICNELFISKSYLQQLFVKHMQISPQKYITAKRLIEAQRSIQLGEKPTDIYLKFGFNDYSSFFRAYKKQFGYPPSQELNHRVERKIYF